MMLGVCTAMYLGYPSLTPARIIHRGIYALAMLSLNSLTIQFRLTGVDGLGSCSATSRGEEKHKSHGVSVV